MIKITDYPGQETTFTQPRTVTFRGDGGCRLAELLIRAGEDCPQIVIFECNHGSYESLAATLRAVADFLWTGETE